MQKLLILTSALLAICVAAPPSNDRLPISPIHADHKSEPIVPAEDLSTLTKSSEEQRKELEKELGIHRERRDHHEGHEKQDEKSHHDRPSGGGDKKVQVQAKPLTLKHEEPSKHEHHKRDVVADKQPEKTATVLSHEQHHSSHGVASKDPLAKPVEKKETPSSCQCKKEKRDVHELPAAVCQCPKEKREVPRPEGDGHKPEQKPNEHPHDDQKDVKKDVKKDSSEESSEEKNKNDKLHASQRQKRDIHELTKEHDNKSKKSSSEESSSSSNESKEENKGKSTSTTALPALSPHNNNRRDLPVPTVPKHEHPASSSETAKDVKPQIEDLSSIIPPSAKPQHAHTATVAHTTHHPTTPGQHPLINNEPIPIKSLRPHDQA